MTQPERITRPGICDCGAVRGFPESLAMCPGCHAWFCDDCEELHQCAERPASQVARDIGAKLARKFGAIGRRERKRR